MKILSIDVGIKNLACCLFEKKTSLEHFIITKWEIIDISKKEDNAKCCFLEKNILCNKLAKFKKDNNCFCLKHSKNQQLQIPSFQQNDKYISKQKIQKLYEIADSYNIKYDKKEKKAQLILFINEFISKHYFDNIESTNAKDIDLFNIGINIKIKLNKLFENYQEIDFVIIENQISPIATRMKTIQGMIVQYFIMANLKVNHIEFISASNKLKDCDIKDKKNYNDRKKLGISKCLQIITNDFRFNDKLDYFNKHNKKDDLSDSFLQGLWFINNKHL